MTEHIKKSIDADLASIRNTLMQSKLYISKSLESYVKAERLSEEKASAAGGLPWQDNATIHTSKGVTIQLMAEEATA
jgi:hypothetical protein